MNSTGPLEMGVGFYSMQSSYMRPRRHSYVYDEAAREARLAEELGFDVFWMGEHHHAYDGYCPSLMPAAAFLAAQTSRIIVATGVLIVPSRRGAHRRGLCCVGINRAGPLPARSRNRLLEG